MFSQNILRSVSESYFDIDEFLTEIESDPFHKSPIPNVHAHKLREQILEAKSRPEKGLKGISLDAAFGNSGSVGSVSTLWRR